MGGIAPHALVTGAAGMIGRKLVDRLLLEGLGEISIGSMILTDIVLPPKTTAVDRRVEYRTTDVSVPEDVDVLVSSRPDVIFHLAAIVSGEAEADFEKGYRINLDGTRNLFEAIRREGLRQPYKPRVILASSLAVFGPPFRDQIDDDFQQTPQASYGAQKLICEVLLADYSRRGIFDGIGIRLPTICIRPGQPNKAASGFFSGILREPLIGREAVLPVPEETRHWFASPRSAIGFLMHAASIDPEKLGARRSLNMPGLSATVGEQIAALGRVAGKSAVELIRRELDGVTVRIVGGWPRDFDAACADALGFKADASFDEIIRMHIDDELNGRIGS